MDSTILSRRAVQQCVPNQNDIRILSVKWRDNVIGYLMKENGVGYFYKYDKKGMQEAKQNGFPYIIGFKDTRKVYVSKELFPTFKSRVPTTQRRDLSTILADLGMESYDEFDILSLSGGKLLTDAISFEEFVPEGRAKNDNLKVLNNTKPKEMRDDDGRES